LLATRALQAKLPVSQPNDPFEQEADRVASQVMRMPAPENESPCPACASGLSPCPTCAARKTHTPAAPTAGPVSTDSPLHDLGPGRPLDPATRAFFEPRFGHDFGPVRVHDDQTAAQSARSLNALAYTLGRDVVFDTGQYAPGANAGRQLLAHELAHVVQQGAGAPPQVARTVSPSTFNCPANTHNAPADPFGSLDAVDRHAQGLTEGSANLAIIASILNPSTDTNGTARAYRARFGNPTQQGARFVNRFNGVTFPTREQASQEEILVIGDRLSRIRNFIGGPIRYTCHRPNAAFQHSNCVSTCRANDVAFSCVPQDLRRIEICPAFWGLSDSQQSIAVIHESVHMLLDFPNHGSTTRAARGRNPECYASFVADLFNINPFDTRCPALP
jgi:hypothetical protein